MRSTVHSHFRFDRPAGRLSDHLRAVLLILLMGTAALLVLFVLVPYVEGFAPLEISQTMRSVELKPAFYTDLQTGVGQQVTPTTAIVTASRLNVRSGPSTATRAIGQVKAGDVLTVVGRTADGSWLQIQTPLEGWVSARYVTLSGTPVASTRAPGSAATAAPTQRPAASGLTGHVVFQNKSGGTIYVLDLATGEQRALTSGAHPAISPDGKKVAFVRGGGDSGLWTIDLDGSNLYRIYEGNTVRTPAWSPDGQWIAFSHSVGYDTCRDLGTDGYYGEFGCVPDRAGLEDFPLVETPIRSLSRVDTSGGDFHDIPSLQRAQAPSWSRNGIVYQDASPSGLQITEDSPSGATRPLLAGFQNQDPDWQPGGGRIVYQSEQNGKWQIMLINPDGSDITALTGPASAAGGGATQNVSPTWSPDGKHILFLSDRGGRWALWTMNPDGSGLQQLAITAAIDYRFDLEQVASWGP